MPSYTVTLPYAEKELGKAERRHSIDLPIEAPDPMVAVQMAIDSIQAQTHNPLASWNIKVDQDGVNVREMSSGTMFRLSDLKTTKEPEEEKQKLLSMEAYLKQVEATPKDKLKMYERVMALPAMVKTPEEAAKKILDLATETSQTEAGSILLKDEKKNELYFMAANGPKAKKIMDFRVPIDQGLAGYCARTGETFAVSDVKSDPRFFRQISESLGYDTRSLLATPVRFGDKIFGVLELINEVPDDRFTGYDLDMARHLGGFLALMLLALGHKSG